MLRRSMAGTACAIPALGEAAKSCMSPAGSDSGEGSIGVSILSQREEIPEFQVEVEPEARSALA